MTIKEKAKTIIRFILFVFAVCFCVITVNEWLKPKYYYTGTWPTTNTYKDFYRLEKDSLDVLLFGSSHAVSALNPQVIYDNYGITSYNLGCEQQSLVVTYYWLREALKYQSPEVVILDTLMMHKYTDAYVYNDMNCSEGAVRKAMDNMRFSYLKWEAGKAIEKIDPTQSGLSFLLLNIRYHTRWGNLGENDYTEDEMIEHGGVKGFTVLGGNNANLSYTPFKDADTDNAEAEEMVETSRIYLDKIVGLCKDKGIQLILVNIPSGESISRYKSTKEYAETRGLPFFDFNEETLYNKIEYDAAENLLGHPNYLGAEKVSNYLGKLLATEYDISPRDDPSYDASRELYEHKIENIKLTSATDAYQYLDMIDKDDYSVFLFGSTSYGAYIDDGIMNRLFSLGFTEDLRGMPDGIHYCAVKAPNGITEKLTGENFALSGSIRGGLVTYSFKVDASNMMPSYRKYNMTIDGNTYETPIPGLNIVIYDNEMKCIIDKININTSIEELTITR